MALLAVVAVFTWINVNRPQANLNLVDQSASDTLPGYYLNEAVITIGGADGTPLYQLEAEQIIHQPADKSVLLTQVKFDYLEQQASPWELRAKQGLITDDQQLVKLFGEVQLVNRGEDSDTPTIVTTETLNILPESYVATTESEVIVSHGQFEMKALGMAADLNQGQVQLKSKIHGSFKP